MQLEQLDWLPFGLSIAVGFLATAILVVNNVRDIETDRRAGKMTLAVRLGRAAHPQPLRGAGRGAFVAVPVDAAGHRRPAWGLLIGCSRRRWRVGPLGRCMTRTDGPALNGALAGTGALLARLQPAVSRRAC